MKNTLDIFTILLSYFKENDYKYFLILTDIILNYPLFNPFMIILALNISDII